MSASACINLHDAALFAGPQADASSGATPYNETGVPLPDVCRERRADRTVPITFSATCTGNEKVRRFFFHPTKHCKRFGVCPNVASYLDQQTDSDINYFLNASHCQRACIDGKLSAA